MKTPSRGKPQQTALVKAIPVDQRILTLRGSKVILDADLAEAYGVTTKALNQAVKRNADRFPSDFTFLLDAEEKAEVVTNCDHLLRLKFSPVLPRAFTEHGAIKEGAIRQKILQMDLLEAVIGLGPNLFYGTGLAACILVFRQRKKRDRKNKVLILDASKEFKTGRAQNELLPEHVARIHGWYRDYKDVAGVARVVTLEEIAANDHNLNIPRYVEPKVDQEVLTVDEAMERLGKSAKAAFAAEEKLVGILKREGLLQ